MDQTFNWEESISLDACLWPALHRKWMAILHAMMNDFNAHANNVRISCKEFLEIFLTKVSTIFPERHF